MRRIPILKGYDYKKEDFIKANLNGELVRVGLNIECGVCNLSCPYCFNEGGRIETDKINGVASIDEIKNWIAQSKELNTKTIVIDGNYEPLKNEKNLLEIIEYIHSMGIKVILITNMLLLTNDLIQKLNVYDISILGKINVPIVGKKDARHDEFANIQNYLTGEKVNNVYEKLVDRINMLIDAGFNKSIISEGFNTTRLGIETVIVEQNFPYINELFMQMIEKNIYVHAERIKPQGYASDNQFYLDNKKVKGLYENIRMSCENSGFQTCVENPVYLQNKCLNHLATININVNGDVIPCPSVDLVVGSLKQESLKSIIENEYMKILRNLHQYISEPCKSCELMKNLDCYGGCRGFVSSKMWLEGKSVVDSLTEADMSCWRVK